MTPQSNILVIAPLKKGCEGELRTLLDSMNFAPGIADPANVLVPFQEFPQIHVARFVILDDPATGDMQAAYGLSPQQYPPCLAFLADFDGPTNLFCDALATGAKAGLKKIFSYCEGFEPGTSIAEWMKTHKRRLYASHWKIICRKMPRPTRTRHSRTPMRPFTSLCNLKFVLEN